jgi:LuxR family transcriptional regulator, maltose regulon positive regulatory protein
MGEAGAAGPPRDLLLATKLAVPPPRPGRVPRPRLLQRLHACRGQEVVLVCAPAGFGKSTLLAEWVRSDGGHVAWLSLDEADNDPVRFWRHVAAALDRAQPGVAQRLGVLAGGPGSTSVMPVVTALVNDLAGSVQDVLLVVDDYHLIQAQDVHRSVAFLLDHLPASLRLVVASRSDPPLPLARLRARGQLAELRAADLRFTPEESGELLAAAAGPDLPDAVVVALAERTEGWAAGLQLAALSLRGRPDVTRFVAEFSGSDRYVLDYLTEEVLEGQPRKVTRFLQESSVLDRLSGPLCDAVLGRSDSQELLETVERANLFLVALDSERRWWRYHRLFADLLQARLRRTDPDRVQALHRAAAVWHEGHGLPDDAVRHALAGGDAQGAARIVEEHLEEQLWRRNERATLARWLTALPPEALARRPRLVLGRAIVAVLGGRLDDAESLLGAVERAGPGPPYRPSVGRRCSILSNLEACVALCRADLSRARGDAALQAEFASAALASSRDADELLRAMARSHLAETDWLAGRLDEAERTLAGILARWSASDEWLVLQRVGFDLGSVQLAQGRLGAALRTYRTLGARVGAAAPALAGMSQVGAAMVLHERDELAEAADEATRGVERCRALAYALPLVDGLVVLARIRLAQGDGTGALAAIDEAATVLPEAGERRVPLGARRAELALALGDVGAAGDWVRGRGLSVDDEPVYPRDSEYRVLARVLIAEGNARAVVPMLDRWRALAVAQGRWSAVIASQVLASLAHAARNDGAAAQATLAEALILAAAEGHLRVFLAEGAPLAAVLRPLLADRRLEDMAGPAGVPRAFLTRLAAAFDRQGTPVLPAARSGAAAVPGLAEPLSPRELEVLRLVAAGRPNRAIAEELYIGLDTVKRHVSHLFAKLRVANRTEAVARARGLGLLD